MVSPSPTVDPLVHNSLSSNQFASTHTQVSSPLPPGQSPSSDASSGKLECTTTFPDGSTSWISCTSKPILAPSIATSASDVIPTSLSSPIATTNPVSTIITSKSLSTTAVVTEIPGTTNQLKIYKNRGVSVGAVAGASIGSLFAGAAIAAAALLLFFRRRRIQRPGESHQHHDDGVQYNGGHSSSEKGAKVLAAAVPINIDDIIPQPLEDDTITKELSILRDNIKNHVRTYYHMKSVPSVAVQASQLAPLAAATGAGASAFIEALHHPSKRGEVIRLFVAWLVLSQCEGDMQPSLLPVELASLIAMIPGRDGRDADQSALYSRWKTITGTLLQHHYSKQSQAAGPQSHGVSETIGALDAALMPFVDESTIEDQRRRNLEMMLSRAANLAFLLFSQPGSFRFDFVGERGEMVVFPGLQQVVSDQARPLNPPRVLYRKEYAEGGI